MHPELVDLLKDVLELRSERDKYKEQVSAKDAVIETQQSEISFLRETLKMRLTEKGVEF